MDRWAHVCARGTGCTESRGDGVLLDGGADERCVVPSRLGCLRRLRGSAGFEVEVSRHVPIQLPRDLHGPRSLGLLELRSAEA